MISVLRVGCLALLAGMLACHKKQEIGVRDFILGVTLAQYPVTALQLDAVEEELGTNLDLVNFFLQWPEDPGQNNFPAESLLNISGRGAIAAVSWEPMYLQGQQEVMIAAEDITGGKYDAYIESFARGAQATGEIIMLRFAH